MGVMCYWHVSCIS